MEDGLSGTGPDVEDGTVTLLDVALAGDLCGRQVTVADNFCILGVRFLQPGEVLLGNDQHVGRCLGVDVLKGEDVGVLVDFLRRNLAANDAAEQAIGVAHQNLTWPNDTIPARELSAARTRLPILCSKVVEGLRVYIPRALEGVIQIREDEMGKEKQHRRQRNRHDSEGQVAERIEQQEKQNCESR